jgi:hypothetical protein
MASVKAPSKYSIDWLLTAVLTAMAVLVCMAGVWAYTYVRSAPLPKAKALAFSVQLSPGLEPAEAHNEPVSLDILPEQPLFPPDVVVAEPPPPEPATPKAKTAPAVQRPSPEPRTPAGPVAKAPPPAEQKKPATQVAKAPTAAPAPPPEAWRVVTTSKAGMMNLGGHIDRNGMVDGMANPHLKDALMKHRNFSRLPAAIRSYISAASSLDLNRLAPYRNYLGMDEGVMEEQGIRFVRVAQR